MSFVAAGGLHTATETDTIENNGFWPALKVAEFRESMRVDSLATPPRLAMALDGAAMDVNAQLLAYQLQQQAAGHDTADDVPPRPGQRQGDLVRLYLRAVWSLAKADLIERYRDYDATRDGHDRADALTDAVDDYRRAAAWAIRDITGDRRTTVELI